jgi:hypothetical protein
MLRMLLFDLRFAERQLWHVCASAGMVPCVHSSTRSAPYGQVYAYAVRTAR